MNALSKTLVAFSFVLGAASANAAPAYSAEIGPSVFDASSQRARAEVVAELAAAKAQGRVNYGEIGPVEVKVPAKPLARAEVHKELLDTVVQRAELARMQRG